MAGWNPRYLVYCRVHGQKGKPRKMLEIDDDRWPGGKMCGFILWIQEQWQKFFELRPDLSGDLRRNPETHAAFDTWLSKTHTA